MALTSTAEVQDQIQKRWAPMFMKELRESLILGSLVNKEYEGQIAQEGDSVYVSQMAIPNGQLKTVGVDADTFDSEQVAFQRVEVKADKVAIASFEVSSMAMLQSQLGSAAGESEMRSSLMFAVEKQVNDYLYSLTSPSTSSPDHLLNSVATMDASQLSTIRTLAAKAKWMKDGRWYALLNPDYYEDILNAQTLTSSDYVNGDQPVVGGQLVNKRFGWNILEDNSRNSAKGLFFHPDYLHLVMQTQPQFKVSDLHSQKKRGFLISVDLVFGAKLGIDGNKKHIYATAAASGIDYNA